MSPPGHRARVPPYPVLLSYILPPPSLCAPFYFKFSFFFVPPRPRRSTQIKTYSWDNAQVLLVGNKCDMEDERVVSAEKGRQLAEHLGECWGGRGGPSPPAIH